MTIIEAIKEVLSSEMVGMTSREIYDEIILKNLYVFPAANPPAVVNNIIRRHCLDLNFPTANPVKHFKIVGYRGKKTLYALIDSSIEKTGEKTSGESKELLPEEVIQEAFERHIQEIKQSLMDSIMEHDPSFFEQLIFEQLIVDLLVAMDYGYDKSAGVVVGGSHDGGIDRIIYEDKLGLDKICLQAKRYGKRNTVG